MHQDLLILPGHTVEAKFRRGVTAADVHAAIDRILAEGGCPKCGLNGIDIRLTRINVLKLEQLGIETLEEVLVTPTLNAATAPVRGF